MTIAEAFERIDKAARAEGLAPWHPTVKAAKEAALGHVLRKRIAEEVN